MSVILQLLLISFVPVLFSIIFTLLERYTNYKNLKKVYKQLIAGLIFGVASILGTVFGVTVDSSFVINARDAAPIIAGLAVSGTSAIIAGFIGGLYRFVSVYWGGSGAFTQVACSVSTVVAGLLAALVRKLVLKNKQASWYLGILVAIFVEDFHMMMVFLTHMDNAAKAYEVIEACMIPMILVTALSTCLSLISLTLIKKEKLIVIHEKRKIGTIVQFALLISLIGSYFVTSSFSYGILKDVVKNNNNTILLNTINDVKNEVNHEVDSYMEKVVLDSKKYVDDNIASLPVETIIENLKSEYNIQEVNFVGTDNIIKYSSDLSYINDDMTSSELSNAFTVLNNGEEVFVQEFRKNTLDDDYKKYAGAALNENSLNIGYIQIGYNEDNYFSIVNNELKDIGKFRHINQKGFVAVCDQDGKIISTSDSAFIKSNILLDLIKIGDYSTYTAKEDDKSSTYYTYADKVEGYYIIAFAEKGESDLPLKTGFVGITIAEIFVFIIAFAVLYVVIKHRVIDTIEHVTDELSNISHGDLNTVIDEHNSLELDSLSNNINNTVDTLKGYIEKEALKNAQELQFAKSIQYSVLPVDFPLNEKFEIFASMNTAKEVGGDFYDFYYTDDDHVFILIADVSGKGIPASLFMMRAKSILKSMISNGLPIDRAFNETNRVLCEGNTAQMFVTAWGAKITLSTGHVEYVNAGHNPPLVGNEKDGFSYIKGKCGFVLAGFEGFRYTKQEFDIKPGDKIYLYTDGVTEATREDKKMFGEDSLLHSLNENVTESAYNTCKNVLNDVKNFVKDAEQSDDITMLCFKYNDPEKKDVIVVEAKMENLPTISAFVENKLRAMNFSEKTITSINIAVDELGANVCSYAYGKVVTGKLKVSLEFKEDNQLAIIKFEDRGIPYNPLDMQDPDTTLSAEERDIGGLGIFIVKKTMDEVNYEHVNVHNVLTIKKRNMF